MIRPSLVSYNWAAVEVLELSWLIEPVTLREDRASAVESGGINFFDVTALLSNRDGFVFSEQVRVAEDYLEELAGAPRR